MFSLKIGLLAGVLIASPFVFSQLWLFVAPGLYAKEKKVVMPFVFFVDAALRRRRVVRASRRVPVDVAVLRELRRTTTSTFMPTLKDTSLVLREDGPRPRRRVPDADAGVLPGALRHRDARSSCCKQFKYAVLIIFIIAAVVTPSADLVNAVRSSPRRCWCSTSSASASPGCSARRRRPKTYEADEASMMTVDAHSRRRPSSWCSVGAGGGLLGSARSSRPQDRVIGARTRIYAAALAAVESEYVEPVDATQLVYGSIDGMLRTLDPHSTLLRPEGLRADARAAGRPLLRHRHQHRRRSTATSRSRRSSRARPRTARASAAATSSRAVGERRARKGWTHRRGRQARQGPEGHDGRHLDPPAGRRTADRSHGRARRDQHRDACARRS